MKKILGIFFAAVALCTLIPSSLVSCTDVGGDGIDSIEWGGSRNPQNTKFRNPVWEPSLEAGTVYKGAGLYVAISSETEWAKGLKYCLPTVTSSDLMNWSFTQQQAFSYDTKDSEGVVTPGTRPSWSSARIVSLSADFAKTVSPTFYWLFYAVEGENAIGVAYARNQQGPFTDAGKLLSAEDLGATSLGDPYFVVFSTKFYLCYTTESGSYVQELTLKKEQLPTLKGQPTKVAGPEMQNVALYRTDSKNYYLFGTVKGSDGKTEIRYARSEKATGPFKDRNDGDLTQGSTGELLIQGNNDNYNPDNVCRVFENADGVQFIAYNATASGNETMLSGYARRPLFITPATLGDDGWFTSVVTPETGWTSPKFK